MSLIAERIGSCMCGSRVAAFSSAVQSVVMQTIRLSYTVQMFNRLFSDISSSKGGALGSAPINSGGASVLLCADGVFLLDFTFQTSSNTATTAGMKRSEKRLLFTIGGKVIGFMKPSLWFVFSIDELPPCECCCVGAAVAVVVVTFVLIVVGHGGGSQSSTSLEELAVLKKSSTNLK